LNASAAAVEGLLDCVPPSAVPTSMFSPAHELRLFAQRNPVKAGAVPTIIMGLSAPDSRRIPGRYAELGAPNARMLVEPSNEAGSPASPPAPAAAQRDKFSSQLSSVQEVQTYGSTRTFAVIARETPSGLLTPDSRIVPGTVKICSSVLAGL
jgi:hypothetical protein